MTLGEVVDRTPRGRDRVVDAVRAASIVVVVVWHWSLSVNQRDAAGQLRNPNPISEVPAAWLLTWLLQVMPLFFVVGGFANRTGWRSTVAGGGGVRQYWARRARRLLVPVAVFVGVWILVDVVGRGLGGGYRPVLEVAPIVFLPLWFVAAYTWVVALTPLTAALHDRHRLGTLLALTSAVAVVDAIRFAGGLDAASWVNTALVWVLIHQLGYFWADGTLLRWGARGGLMLAGAGVLCLAALTSLSAYPRSMVATPDDDVSHMYPPTAVLAVVAVSQLGLVAAVHHSLARWLERRRAWVAVVAFNAVILTVFLWHMTALLAAVLVYEAFGGTLGDEPTVGWWLQRPLWVVGPALLLVPLVAVFGRVETGRRRGRRDATSPT